MAITKIIDLKLVPSDKFRNQVRAYGRIFEDMMAQRAKPTVGPEVTLDTVMLHARYEDDPVALALLDLAQQLIEANTRGQEAADRQDEIVASMEASIEDQRKALESVRTTNMRLIEERQVYDQAIAESFLDSKQRRRMTTLIERGKRLLAERDRVAGFGPIDATLPEGVGVTFYAEDPLLKPGTHGQQSGQWTEWGAVKDTMGRPQSFRVNKKATAPFGRKP